MRTTTIVAVVLASCLAAGCNQRGKKAMAEPSSAGAEVTPAVPAAGQDQKDASTPSGISTIANEAMPEPGAAPGQRDADATPQVPPAGARAMFMARPAGPDLPPASNIVEAGLTGDEVVLIRRAETRGRAIYLHDVYAARATDLVAARGVDLVKVGARGRLPYQAHRVRYRLPSAPHAPGTTNLMLRCRRLCGTFMRPHDGSGPAARHQDALMAQGSLIP